MLGVSSLTERYLGKMVTEAYKMIRFRENGQREFFFLFLTVLEPKRFRKDKRRRFVTQHIIRLWDSLPQDVVMSTS